MPRNYATRHGLLRRCAATIHHKRVSFISTNFVGAAAAAQASQKALSVLALPRRRVRSTTTTTTRMTLRSFHHSSRITFAREASSPIEPTWRQIFPAEQYISIWEPHYFPDNKDNASTAATTTSALLKDQDPALDIATKNVIAQLQKFYRRGFMHTPIFVTRERCHFLLEQLAATPSSSSSRKRGAAANTISWERTQRADALLSAMHLMDALQARTTPFELPRPNGRTYRLVLEIFARTRQSPSSSSSSSVLSSNDEEQHLAVAMRARDWVLRMQRQYIQAADLQLQPTVVEWNLVLQTYANSPHTDRARKALDVLQQYMLSASNKDDGSRSSSAAAATLTVDASSFSFLARACGYNIPNDEAATAGAHCAAQVWELLTSSMTLSTTLLPTLSSHFYSLMLQSIRHMAPSALRERLFEEIFDQARTHGKCNTVVVQEFLINAKPIALVEYMLGANRLKAVLGLSAKEAARKLVDLMPADWTKHRDGN